MFFVLCENPPSKITPSAIEQNLPIVILLPLPLLVGFPYVCNPLIILTPHPLKRSKGFGVGEHKAVYLPFDDNLKTYRYYAIYPNNKS